ncbi:MAG: hypothetical protein L0287_12685 [Anaerolineae bacterium]|nr:hypothetical protein [Anaerolineae bacterium]MCI0608328.1 hypothetical protein [Anaerolineae bacterium]
MNSTDNVERARPFGRLLRLLFGAIILFSAVPYYFIVPMDVVIQTILVVLGLVVFYILLDLVINKVFPSIHPVAGAILANTPILLMWLLGRNAIQLGALSFLGISLVLTALRADKGCEVMSIPGLIFNRHTHLACFFFSPIDWLETKFAGKSQNP